VGEVKKIGTAFWFLSTDHYFAVSTDKGNKAISSQLNFKINISVLMLMYDYSEGLLSDCMY